MQGRDLKVSKLDAAKRQLETAIRLYFSNGDPVSIHTLVAAAYAILHDVTGRKGADPMLIRGHEHHVTASETSDSTSTALMAVLEFT